MTLTCNGYKIYGLIEHSHFLDGRNHRCVLEKTDTKLITCLVYPVTLGYPGNPKRIFLDTEDCPMAGQVSEEFRAKAFGLIEMIVRQLPDWWLELNAEYCGRFMTPTNWHNSRAEKILRSKNCAPANWTDTPDSKDDLWSSDKVCAINDQPQNCPSA